MSHFAEGSDSAPLETRADSAPVEPGSETFDPVATEAAINHDGVKDITFGDEPAKAEPIPIAWEDQIHDEAADAADVGVKDSRYVDPVEDETWAHERRC